MELRSAHKRECRERRSLEALRRGTMALFTRQEVEALARKTSFYQRAPRAIRAFEFVLCTTLAAVVEAKRGFASIWRMLSAAAGVVVARSAVTQRFGYGSGALMQELFELTLQRLPQSPCPELASRLKQFKAVLANDGSVLMLSPLLAKLFPATRTNSVACAGKLHATADLVHRRLVRVRLTGERFSELKAARAAPIEPGTLYMSDLGYTSYDYFAEIKEGKGELLSRLKDNANPRIVAVRHGVRAPVATVSRGLRLRDPELRFTECHNTFDVDAEFHTKDGTVQLRVVGVYDEQTSKYHCYVTTLSPQDWSAEELAALYTLRWEIELLFKLLKSSCHLDHLDTSDPHAVRTLVYASLLAATILNSMCHDAAQVHEIPTAIISPLMAGIAAPLVVLPLLLLWLDTDLSPEQLSDSILRVLAIGCRNQNPRRTRHKWGQLGNSARTAQPATHA
jgi:putative transposase